jgi:gamma-glutamyltranspeptidase/glutathione hydrolase
LIMFDVRQMARPGRAAQALARPLAAVLLLATAALAALAFLLEHAWAQQPAVLSERDIVHPVFAERGMVASQESLASRIGVEVLEAGGNAVDAAVAVGFALAVTLPRAGNLGGGGFMLVHDAESGETVAIDYREMAPAAAHADLFLDAAGEVDSEKAWYSRFAAGVPGTVAGLALALERYGTLSLAEALAPAIRLAEDGIVVTRELSQSLAERRERLLEVPATATIFFDADGRPPQPGARLIQADLAWSLKQIARDGPAAFYRGAIAERIAADMAANGGPMTLDDLAGYRAVVRRPVHGRYRGYDVYSMPPPSSGGVHLIQILNILEGYPLGELGHNGAASLHLMAEAMKLAYADRSRHLGDPDFWPVPVAGLTAKAYAEAQRATIDPERARPADEIGPGDPAPYESRETTHFSVMDRWGNAVANTYTLNFGYGSGIVAAGTGILLNNEMDDFSSKPGVPNAYGLIGGAANAIEPGKRPLSSMTPTIVAKDGRAFLATGSPGGSRIISTTLQILLNVIDHGLNVAAATYAPRVHHQWLPDELRVERGLSPDTLARLAAMGHTVVEGDAMGSTQSVLRADEGFYGAADPRRPGALAVGY